MPQEKLKQIYYDQISGPIYDFQRHVREVTGGDDRTMVDSTELVKACESALLTAYHQGILAAKEQLPEARLANHYPADWDNGFNRCREIVLSSLDTLLAENK